MTDESERSLSDDELIARLRRASPEPPPHDPSFDIPVADEVDVPGDGAFHGPGPQCAASGSRKTAIQGAYGVLVTEPIKCELEAGHGGAHRAGFRRTHVLHHWKAYEWSSPASP
ncbi:MAG TPA: hypothetical protein VFN68_03745 [Acidimicrobiales bacterium]|nr:hypothetical protein [Acidimicrobiales bacterium]